MSDLNVKNEVEDFSDLGSPIEFKFRSVRYFIPAVTPFTSRKLIKMSRTITKKSEQNEKLLNEYKEKGLEIPEELEDEMGKIFDFQLDFIILAGLQIVSDGEGETSIKTNATKDSIEMFWSNKLTSKVFGLINTSMSSEIEQEKKL